MNEIVEGILENADDDMHRAYTNLRAALPCGGWAIVKRAQRPPNYPESMGDYDRYVWRIEGAPTDSDIYHTQYIAAKDALQSCGGTFADWSVRKWQIWLETQADRDPANRAAHWLAIKTLENWKNYP